MVRITNFSKLLLPVFGLPDTRTNSKLCFRMTRAEGLIIAYTEFSQQQNNSTRADLRNAVGTFHHVELFRTVSEENVLRNKKETNEEKQNLSQIHVRCSVNR